MKLVIGLGNPGQNYAKNRHNVGFMTIDFISKQYQIPLILKAARATMGMGKISGYDVILAKPKTYVNNSGIAVKTLMQMNKLNSKDIIVIHDDMDIPLGQMRIRTRGSSGGHKGIQSIIEEIETTEFIRIKIGIGRPPNYSVENKKSDIDVISYVLSDFSPEEEAIINKMIRITSRALESILRFGTITAMNKYNRADLNLDELL